jgi:hypothetical protein
MPRPIDPQVQIRRRAAELRARIQRDQQELTRYDNALRALAGLTGQATRSTPATTASDAAAPARRRGRPPKPKTAKATRGRPQRRAFEEPETAVPE